MKKHVLFAALTLFATNTMADVTRHALPNNSTFPISRAVEVTPDTTLIFHSGMVPGPVNAEATKGSREYYGDTETQALNVFKRFESSFERKRLESSLQNVLKVLCARASLRVQALNLDGSPASARPAPNPRLGQCGARS